MLFKRKKKVLRRFSIVNLEQDAILQRRNDRTRSFDVIKVAESDEEKTVLTITEKKANKIVKCLNEIFDEMFNEQGCYVETQVTIQGETISETLAIMDNANKAILANDVTSTNVDKSIKRCLTKNLGLFGLDLNLWEGEELSDEAKELKEQKAEADKKAKNELTKAIKEVVDLGNELIKSGVAKEAMMEIIQKHNDGNGNPTALKTVEMCAAAKADLLKLKKAGKATPAPKQETK